MNNALNKKQKQVLKRVKNSGGKWLHFEEAMVGIRKADRAEIKDALMRTGKVVYRASHVGKNMVHEYLRCNIEDMSMSAIVNTHDEMPRPGYPNTYTTPQKEVEDTAVLKDISDMTEAELDAYIEKYTKRPKRRNLDDIPIQRMTDEEFAKYTEYECGAYVEDSEFWYKAESGGYWEKPWAVEEDPEEDPVVGIEITKIRRK